MAVAKTGRPFQLAGCRRQFRRSPNAELVANVREGDVNNVAHLVLGVLGDADDGRVAINLRGIDAIEAVTGAPICHSPATSSHASPRAQRPARSFHPPRPRGGRIPGLRRGTPAARGVLARSSPTHRDPLVVLREVEGGHRAGVGGAGGNAAHSGTGPGRDEGHDGGFERRDARAKTWRAVPVAAEPLQPALSGSRGRRRRPARARAGRAARDLRILVAPRRWHRGEPRGPARARLPMCSVPVQSLRSVFVFVCEGFRADFEAAPTGRKGNRPKQGGREHMTQHTLPAQPVTMPSSLNRCDSSA